MLNDTFRIRYKTIPLAVSFQNNNTEITVAHNHSEFEVLLITQGVCSVGINGRTIHAEAGDIIFINPFEVHSVRADASLPYSHKCICFDCSLISDSNICDDLKNEVIRIMPHIKAQCEHSAFLTKIILDIISCHEDSGKYIEMEIGAYISILFAYLFKNTLIDKDSKKSKNTLFCSEVLKYISIHYGENISSKAVSAALSYNQSYFCRAFKKNFDMSFSDYLNRYRVVASRKLLEADSKSITEIALECGFNTPAYFTKCFKSHFGILPSEYKKSI